MTEPQTAEQKLTISRALAVRLNRLLELYADSGTYTYRQRTGGVLQGCPRGPQITPERLALGVSIVRDAFLKEIEPQW